MMGLRPRRLWRLISGNFLCDEKGQPVLIDPAPYFGHRSMDLAMTTLFGGFERPFYESYAYHYPFPANYREQWEICNLYPLLVHLKFIWGRPSSGGRSYPLLAHNLRFARLSEKYFTHNSTLLTYVRA